MSAEAVVNRVYFALFLVSIVFLSFVAGSVIVLNKSFPYGYLYDAYRAGLALFEKETEYPSPLATNLWARARTQDKGVVIYDPARAYNGLTLYTSGHEQTAYLIAMDGTVVHQWHLPFSAVWDETAAVKTPRPDPYVFIENAYVYPNGDLLALYIGLGDTPWGYGLVKMDKDSKVIWKYLQQTHHDFDVAANGEITVLTHEIRKNVIVQAAHLEPPRVDDFVVVLSPDGKELKKVSVLDAFANSDYLRLLSTVAWYTKGDYLHTNAVELIDSEKAKLLPFASEGQVLISCRDIGVIAVLDLDTEKIVWAMRGSWLGQHDPDILPNGHILLFDNYGHYGSGGISRVIEIDPVTQQIVWSYAGDESHFFQSKIRSNVQRLPNGNTLITESDAGQILEVTPDHDIVWDYVNPVRVGDAGEFIPVTSWGQRIDPKSLDPDFLGPE